MRVSGEVIQLPGIAVVILLERLEPMQGFLPASPVEDVLEAGRQEEVLVDGEGHAVVEVLYEFVTGRSHHPHGVVHGHLMQVVTGIHSCRLRGVWLQKGQERLTSQVDTTSLVKDAVVWVGEVEPLQHSGHNVQ